MALQLPHNRVSQILEPALIRLGEISSWIWFVLMIIVVINVALRHVVGEGRVELEELQWHLNAIGFLMAAIYTFQMDGHIRIDLVSSRLPERHQAWVEAYGIVLMLLLFLGLVVWFAIPFVGHSWQAGEVSQSPGGLPYRWFLKAVLPIALTILFVAALIRLARVWALLSGASATESAADPVAASASGHNEQSQ